MTEPQKLRPKHVPQRTCVGCQRVRPKRELVRIVQTTFGSIEIDPRGKKSGRGAYLCKAQGCWGLGLGKKRLQRALRTEISPEHKAKLLEYSKTLPATESE